MVLADMLVPGSKHMLNADNIRGIERRNSVPEGTFVNYVGRSLPALLRDRRWYSQTSIPLQDGEALVTTAFVSALAGFLLLAEVLKEVEPPLQAYGLRGHYEQELLGIPNGFRNPGQRDPSGRCLCHDPFRQRVYKQKYATATPAENPC
jgi:hypothetical protein